MAERVPPDKEQLPPIGGPLADVFAAKSPLHIFTEEEVGFFEGAEKLLEIWFDIPREGGGQSEAADHDKLSRGLRVIPK